MKLIFKVIYPCRFSRTCFNKMQMLLLLFCFYQSSVPTRPSTYLNNYIGASPFEISININDQNENITKNEVLENVEENIPSLKELMESCREANSVPQVNYTIEGKVTNICKYLPWYERSFGGIQMRSLFGNPENAEEADKWNRKLFQNVEVEVCQKRNCSYHTIRNDTLSSLNAKFPKTISQIRFIKGRIEALYASSISNLPTLELLHIEGVGLAILEEKTFKNLDNLKHLSLKHNRLMLISSDVFQSLKSLQYLHLEYNSIKAISSDAFADMYSLKCLYLSHNSIRKYELDWFQNNHELKTLDFSHNKIKSIPKHAFKILNLAIDVEINFDHNQIEEIGQDLFDLETKNVIGSLRLSYNKIKNLKGDLRSFFMALYVHIDGNPFTCEGLQRLIDYLIYHKHPGVTFTRNDKCKLNIPAKLF